MNSKWSAAACRAAVKVVVCLLVGAVSAGAQSLPSPWSARDIGSPVLAGSASASNGVFRIDAAGADIWDASDQFHFVYQAITGDTDVRARVDSLIGPHGWAKAGVMIRSSLDANAAHGYALVSLENGVAFQRRPSPGSASLSTGGPWVTAPDRVRLVRAGTTVTAYSSPDGTQWTEIATETIALGGTAYVGVATVSHDANARATAMMSSVAIATSSTALPAGQLSADIGAPAVAGTATFSSGAYTIRAAGADIWDTSDQFRYVYQQVSGDVDVIARVASVGATDVWAKAGVMIRETLAADSRHAFSFLTPTYGWNFQRRPEPGGLSEHTSGRTGGAPGWVRLVRKGSLFEAYQSTDGQNWTPIGTDTIPMTTQVYVGIAVTSHNAGTATTAVVDNLKITEATAPANRPPTVTLTSPTSGQQFTAPATFTVTAAATDVDGRITAVEFYRDSTLLGRELIAPYTVNVSALPQGTYSLRAVAIDDGGASTQSATVSVTVTAASGTTAPRAVAFTASTDHATLVTKDVLEIHRSGTTPGSSTPVATSDLGKPAVASNGEIIVDRATFFEGLATGNYVATVLAVGSSASGRSAPVTFTR